jgi:rhombotail lipoprotein
MTTNVTKGAVLLLVFAMLGIAGCMNGQRSAQGTSVMQFLYPKQLNHTEQVAVPVLSLPLRVGIAFVPLGAGNPGGYWMADPHLSEAKKQQLMKQVADQFRGLAYVSAIEVIPSTYLRPEGGFANLDQVKSMFNVDVIALVAYDQVQFTGESVFSLAYWTIVGSYVVKGERNDTQTLMETVVFDVASRRMLFRAPGMSQVKAAATPVNQSEALRKDSETGFSLATVEMIANLKTELASFRERVKQQPNDIQIVHKPGYTGAGSFGLWGALALAGLAGWAGRRLR